MASRLAIAVFLLFASTYAFDTQKLMKQLSIDEGNISRIYFDHLGLKTFGIGHLIIEGESEFGKPVGTKVSKLRIEEAFEEDVQITLGECRTLFGKYWNGFPEEAKQVFANMMFNLGRPRLSGFKKMIKYAKLGDWKNAAMEGRDSRWYHQVGDRAERLMRRLEGI